MSTYRELTYMVLDELKVLSDDSYITEDHVMFLLEKYRTFLLKLKYSDVKKVIPESNYLTICLHLEEVPTIVGTECIDGSFLKTKEKIPFLLPIGNKRVYPVNYYYGEITYVSRDRMRYIGYNKYLLNIIYASLGPDNYLYLKSCNPQYLYLKKIKMTGIFEDPRAILELQCQSENGDIICDTLDMTFPIEESLVPPMIELVVKELLGTIYRPKDENNDANDDLSNVTVKL